VLSPDEIRNRRNGEVPSGPGSHVLSAVDKAALFSLTGTSVDASTIGKWFNNAFPIMIRRDTLDYFAIIETTAPVIIAHILCPIGSGGVKISSRRVVSDQHSSIT
jgi:hypothetical protein